ncbi:MAG: 4Fe-4S binding protein [Bacteroidetes bacterium]|nr:4Fe-4S binding protein [Bacteroidota bacterium]
MLKQQAQTFQHRIDSILNRINELSVSGGKQKKSKEKTSVKAFIDENKCTGCGTCVDVCNQGAITVNRIAKVDLEKCTGCGICVNTCPNEALTLRWLDNQHGDNN